MGPDRFKEIWSWGSVWLEHYQRLEFLHLWRLSYLLADECSGPADSDWDARVHEVCVHVLIGRCRIEMWRFGTNKQLQNLEQNLKQLC